MRQLPRVPVVRADDELLGIQHGSQQEGSPGHSAGVCGWVCMRWCGWVQVGVGVCLRERGYVGVHWNAHALMLVGARVLSMAAASSCPSASGASSYI